MMKGKHMLSPIQVSYFLLLFLYFFIIALVHSSYRAKK